MMTNVVLIRQRSLFGELGFQLGFRASLSIFRRGGHRDLGAGGLLDIRQEQQWSRRTCISKVMNADREYKHPDLWTKYLSDPVMETVLMTLCWR